MTLQPLAGHEDKQNTQRGIDEDDGTQDHDAPLGNQLAHVRLADGVERQERVLAEAEEAHDGVEHVLMRRERVHADGEGENQLQLPVSLG